MSNNTKPFPVREMPLAFRAPVVEAEANRVVFNHESGLPVEAFSVFGMSTPIHVDYIMAEYVAECIRFTEAMRAAHQPAPLTREEEYEEAAKRG